MKMTVGRKLGLGFGIVVLFLVACVCIGIIYLSGVNSRLNTIVNVHSTRQLLGVQIKQDLFKIHRAEKNFLLETNPEDMDRYQVVIDSYESEMYKKLDTLSQIATPEGQDYLDAFIEDSIANGTNEPKKVPEDRRHDCRLFL